MLMLKLPTVVLALVLVCIPALLAVVLAGLGVGGLAGDDGRLLGPWELSRLEGLGEVVMVPSGTRVFQKGDAPDFLYLVLDGVMVPEASLSGQPSFWVGPGDVCGELSFVLGTPRSTTMIALGPSPRLWRIHRDVRERGVTVLGGRRPWVNWCQPVADRHDHRSHCHGYVAA